MKPEESIFYHATCHSDMNQDLASQASKKSRNSAEEFFTHVYENGLWGKDEDGNSTSGTGSSLKEGIPFINIIQNLLKNHNISSVVDLGCGDWELAKEINWGQATYLGLDVVESIIRKNQKLYSSDKINFLLYDAESDTLPQADLLICKDVLMHLPNSYIFEILAQSKKFKYCVFINDVNPLATINKDIPSFGFRVLNLTLDPFNLVPTKVDYYLSGLETKQVILLTSFLT